MNRPLSKVIRALAVMAAAGVASISAYGAACNIYMTSNQQAIDGFGFSTAWCGTLTTAKNNALYNTLGMSILRVQTDGVGSDQTANAAVAHSHGLKVFGTQWTIPSQFAATNASGQMIITNGPGYATWLHNAAITMNLDYVSFQNEPEGQKMPYSVVYNFVKSNCPAIGKPILMPESWGFDDGYSDPVINDPSAVTNFAILGGHLYAGGLYAHTNAIAHGKPVWQTEYYISNSKSNWTACITLAKNISDCMNDQMNAYCAWWVYDADNSVNLVDSSGNIFMSGYTFGQFAKWIRPGSTRVTADYNPSFGVYVTAYKVNGGTVIVALNTNISSTNQQFNIWNGNASTFEGYQSVTNLYMADIGSFSALGGSFTATLPGQSVTTFVQTGFSGLGLTGTNMTWSAPVPITTADATLSPPPGQALVGAATFGATAYTVTLTSGLQINFTTGGSVATATGGGTATGGFSGNTGNANFNSVLNEFNYDNGPKTITLNNLTPGTRYAVQFFGVDDRSGEHTRQAYLQDTNQSGNISATWQMGSNVYVMSTFTASSPTKTIIEQLPGNSSGGDVNLGNANALVLWTASVTPASSPMPTNGAVNIAFNTALSWTTGSNAVFHAMYLGTSSNAVTQATNGSPQFQGILATTNYYPPLNGSATNYWRVDEINGTNTAVGAVWSFVTAPLPALVHRYSFLETGGIITADSVGGPAWPGALPNGGTLGGSQLTLASGSSQYVSLPAAIVSTLSNFTIMAWVNLASTTNWARIFDFGNSTTTYMYLAPQNGTTGTLRFAITTNSYGNEQAITNNSTLTTNTWHQVAVSLNGGTGILYLDGAPVGTNSAMTFTPSILGITTNNFVGKSQWPDPYLNGALDEFRIYSVGLSPAEVAAAYALGAGQLLNTNSPMLGVTFLPTSVTLSWPLASAGFTVQSCTNLSSGNWMNVTSPEPQIIGGQWQITLPSSGNIPATFYRLLK